MSSPPRPSTASARRVFLSPTGQRRTTTLPLDNAPVQAPSFGLGGEAIAADAPSSVLEWPAFVRLGLDEQHPPSAAAGQSQPQGCNLPGLTPEAEQFHLEMDERNAAPAEFVDSSSTSSGGLAVFTIPRPVAGAGRSQQPAAQAPLDHNPDSANSAASLPTAEPVASTSTSEPTAKPKRERKKKEGHQPRPANAWILYRSAQIQKLRTDEELAKKPQSEVSKLISYMWRDEAPEVRKHYEDQAAIKKVEHAAMYPNYVYAPQRKDARRAGPGEPAEGPVRTPSGRLSRAGRPAARRGRALTSDDLPAEARIRTPGLETLGQYGAGAAVYSSGAEGVQMTPSTSGSSSSTGALVSPGHQLGPSALAHAYNLEQAEHDPLAAPYQQSTAMEAYDAYTYSAQRWHPHDHHAPAPGTPTNEYWHPVPPMSAPAAMSHFNLSTTYDQVLHHQPPMSSTTASTADWNLMSGQSAPSTAASSVPRHPTSGSVRGSPSPWTEVGSLPSSGYEMGAYPAAHNNYDPALIGDVGGAYGSAAVGAMGEGGLHGAGCPSFREASEYAHPMSSEMDAGVEWENHQHHLQMIHQHDHQQGYAFPPSHQ